MIRCRLFLATLLTAIFPVSALKAESVISVDFFYDQLDPHGNWFEMGDYGYVWQPHDTDSEWTPYSDGRWVYTEAGWTWFSNEPFGWAVYHYGRWEKVREVGWVWVPGREWGPGWVSWRRGPRHVGWAPLPPEARFTAGIGFSSWVDRYYGMGPDHYRFVEPANLGASRLSDVMVDYRRNIAIINETTNITTITYREGIVHNGGLAYDEQLRASREPIPRYQLERRREFTREGRRILDDELSARVEGDTLRVADLPVGKSLEGRPAKVKKAFESVELDRGWRNVGPPDEIAAAREKIRNEAELPAELPDKAENADRHPELSEAVPGLPPAPRVPVDGKGMKGEEGDLPPDPAAPLPPADRPAAKAVQRPESKGTMKDPAQPGTSTGHVPTVEPEPAVPVSPRPPAPGQVSDHPGEPVPAGDKETRDGGPGPMPAAPGRSATPPLPPPAPEAQSSERSSPARANDPSPQSPDRSGNAPSKNRDREEEKR